MFQNSFVFCTLASVIVMCFGEDSDPDLNRDLPGLINSRGFECEIHKIVTDDGYVLGYYRVVNPTTVQRPELQKRPVIIHHGLLSSAVDFVVNSPGGDHDPSLLEDDSNSVNVDDHEEFIKVVENSSQNREVSSNLGFALANLGYDVWLGNSRGNTYSREHKHLDVKDQAFWKFSTDEMIKYDLPAAIDYILKVTGKESLGYIGHSQGSLLMFGLLATRIDYTEKVKPFIALGPVAAFEEVNGLGGFITKNPPIVAMLRRMHGEFLPQSSFMKYITKILSSSPFRPICTNLIFLICGYDHQQMNVTREPVYLAHDPSGTSWQNMYHYSQMIRAKRWQMFDHGKSENEIRYGSPDPPKYSLEAIKSQHIAIVYGENDLIVTLKNVAAIKNSLQVPLLDDYLVPFPKWNHVDFMWGIEAGKYVYTRVIDNLKKYDSVL